jgi:hypothetical protein
VTLREAPPSSCTRSTKAIGPSAANVKDLRQDLRAVTKKCRPSWEITTPELKKAWSEGRKDRTATTHAGEHTAQPREWHRSSIAAPLKR